MEVKRTCKKRMHYSWDGMDYCLNYEMTTSEAEERITAEKCTAYEEGTPDCLLDKEYTPSATGGDYGPSNPWDAPGMSIQDFF